MAIPFGFGVGDFLAISKLIYKIGLELKKNPESASDYQLLLIELESLDRALKQLQRIKPAHHDLRRLEGIRALAITCQRPLEEFLAKIEKFEEHLGSWKVKGNRLSRFGRGLQWSIKYKEDVEELRARLTPNVATITVLLMTQTVDTLSKAKSDRFGIARHLRRKLSFQRTSLTHLKQTALNIEAELTNLAAGGTAQDQEFSSLQLKADELLKDSIAHELHLNNQDAILEDIRDSGNAINAQTRETHAVATAIHQSVAGTQATATFVLGLALDITIAITAGISKMQEITKLIAQMITLTTRFTVEMRETMRILLQAFWDTQARLARLERFLPRQIDLPVVRFRDAFNEMRSLPYDLSRQWQTFQGLVAVVFTNRQGLHRVKMGQYFVTNARLGQRLNSEFWSNAIEPGDELSMTMVLDDIEAEGGFCPFKSCGASTKDVEMRRGGKFCPNCCRFAALSQRKGLEIQGLESHHTPPAPDVDLESLSDYAGNREAIELEEAPVQVPELEASASEDIELYYSIQVVQALLSNACQRDSLDTRASAHSSEDGDSSPCSDGDDADSYDTPPISDDESDTEDIHHYITLGAWSPALGQTTFMLGICDTGAAVSVISYAKARLVAPDGISDDVTHLNARTLDALGGTVTVHGPIWVEVWLEDGGKGNRIRCKVPFYVLPRNYGEGGFDLLLSRKVVKRLELVRLMEWL